MIRKASPWVVAGCMLGLNSAVYALGLGEITLHSNLNQPLNAEIRLLSADSLTKEQIITNLAKAEEFKRTGVQYNFFLHQLRFKPVFNKDGSVIIQVTTKDPVKEPFLDFLVEVNWPNGRVMREYTLLLDPPVFSKVQLSSRPKVATASQNQSRSAESVNDFNAVQTRTISNDNWNVATEGEYTVKNADTLWSIARKNRPRNASIQRTMVAIYQSNPDAFINNNMNTLKKGSVLKIPDESGVDSLSQQQALLEIARQNQLWGGRGNAGTRPDVVIDTAEYAKASGATGAAKARLKLTAAGAGEGGSNAALESEAVATLSDEIDTLKTRLQDKSERIDKLERLLSLKDTQISSLQDSQEDTEKTVTDANQSAQEKPVVNTETLDDPQQNTSATPENTQADVSEQATESVEVSDGVTNPQDINADQNKQNQTAATNAETTTAVNTTPTEEVVAVKAVEKSFLDSVMALGTTVWMAVGSGTLVLFFAVLWFRRRNMEEEAFQESLVVPVGGDLNEDDLPDVGDDILANEMGIDSEYIPESEAILDEEGALDVESNTDPLGEADVYLAYGKYDQAERILRDALDEAPERTDLRLKLMECFAENKAMSEFKDQKREILDVLATDSAVAEKVSIMEREAWPEEAATDELPSTEDIFGDLSFADDDESAEEDDDLVFPEDSAEIDEQSAAGDLGNKDALDFSSPTSSTVDEQTVAEDDDEMSDDKRDKDDEFIASNEDTQASVALENTGLDFESADLDFSESKEQAAGSEESLSTEGIDFISESELIDTEISDDDLDEEIDEEGIDETLLDLGDVDEASTKLDLARAYIDMEDYDGASEILQEVLTEGNDEQKTEAKDLISQIE